MQFLIDMNLSPEWKAVMQAEGWSAIHWSDIGAAETSDETIMNWAVSNQSIVFTHDLDFAELLALTGAKAPSVVQLRTRSTLPERIANQVVLSISEAIEYLEQGALVTIEPARSRVRVLPLT